MDGSAHFPDYAGGGFVNVTGHSRNRGFTNRYGADLRQQYFGTSATGALVAPAFVAPMASLSAQAAGPSIAPWLSPASPLTREFQALMKELRSEQKFAAGIYVARRWPAFTRRIHRPMQIFSVLVLVGFIGGALVMTGSLR